MCKFLKNDKYCETGEVRTVKTCYQARIKQAHDGLRLWRAETKGPEDK